MVHKALFNGWRFHFVETAGEGEPHKPVAKWEMNGAENIGNNINMLSSNTFYSIVLTVPYTIYKYIGGKG